MLDGNLQDLKQKFNKSRTITIDYEGDIKKLCTGLFFMEEYSGHAVISIDIYNTWFMKNCAIRLSKTMLRCFPLLIIAFLLPKPYSFTLPSTVNATLLFIPAMFLGFMVASLLPIKH